MSMDISCRRCWACGEWAQPVEREGWLCCPNCGEQLEYLDHCCSQCGARWETIEDGSGPQKCPRCGFIPELPIEGIGDLAEEQLGKQLGKYSWCRACRALTLNVPGDTYSNVLLKKQVLRWRARREWRPDYPRLRAEHVRRSARGDRGGLRRHPRLAARETHTAAASPQVFWLPALWRREVLALALSLPAV